MSGKKEAPDAPNYRKAAEMEAASSREVTNMQNYANRPNQNTPFGSMDWDAEAIIDPATGQKVTQWTQNLTLDPSMQEALDAQQRLTRGRSSLAEGMLNRAEGEFAPMVDWDSYTPLEGVNRQTLQTDLGRSPGQYRDAAEEAIYGKATSRLDPMFADREQAMDIKLRNQGLTPGTEAYDKAMRNETFARNDAYSGAMRDAIIGGREEAESMFGMDLGAAGFGNQARQAQQGMDITRGGYQNTMRQQQIAEEMQRRGFTLNEINAILSGQQVGMPTMPGFNAASRSDATNYLGAAQLTGQSNLDQFNAEQQAWQGLMSGVAGFVPGG